MKLRGMTWWIDRWRQSTAFIDLTLEEQGAYRNLCEEAWLRGGAIPNDPRVLARASGDAVRWPKLKAKVMRRFHMNDGEWHNETVDELMAKAHQNTERQRNYREKVTPLSRVGHGGNRNRNRNREQ
jgi:uncharacterized protein YdaU (DUF1376 family)